MPIYFNSRPGCLASVPRVTRTLIIINLCIFVVTLINKSFMTSTFALFYPTSQFFHFWQPFTYMFMHGGFAHILFNMYTLFIFGSAVERIIGEKKFLLLYFICGLGAAALHYGAIYLQIQSYMEAASLGNAYAANNIAMLKSIPTVGASGAIYGLLIAYAMLFPDSRMTLLFPPITLSAKWMVIAFAGIEILFGITGKANTIAHFAHLGGMLIGYLMMLYWRNKGNLFDREDL